MRRTEAWPALAHLASTQYGLVTTAQAEVRGLSRPQLGRLCDAGYLAPVERGLYLLAGRQPDSWFLQRVAWVQLVPTVAVVDRLHSGDPLGVLSHETAAWLLDLGTIDAWNHEFTVSPGTKVTNRDDSRLHEATEPITRSDWVYRDGLPVTTPERTVRDLAAGGIDGDHLAQVVRDALVKYADRPSTYEKILAPFAHDYDCQDGADFLRECVLTAGVSEVSKYLGRVAA